MNNEINYYYYKQDNGFYWTNWIESHCANVLDEKIIYVNGGLYKYWLGVDDVDILYPINPIIGDKIEVLVKRKDIYTKIDWIEGKRGLYEHYIRHILDAVVMCIEKRIEK